MRRVEGAVVAVAAVGGADGSCAAAAALACAGSGPDSAALLVDFRDGGRPRPTLLASAAARALEERLAAHLPEAAVASRGQTCHLALPPDREGVGRLPSVLPLVRASAAALHLPPSLLNPALEALGGGVKPGVVLRGDLGRDRPLIALAVRHLLEQGHRVWVQKRPLPWLASRRALLGLPSPGSGGLPPRFMERLLDA